MRTRNEIEKNLGDAYALHRDADRLIVAASLELLIWAMDEHHPGAERLHIETTDQDLSGSLIATEVETGDDVTPIADDAFDVLSEVLANLDDSNQSHWVDFLVDGVSRREGPTPFDLAKLRQHFAAADDELTYVHGVDDGFTLCGADLSLCPELHLTRAFDAMTCPVCIEKGNE